MKKKKKWMPLINACLFLFLFLVIRVAYGADNAITETPFNQIINWSDAKERENYEELLNKEYILKAHEIYYTDSQGQKIKNLWYEQEFFKLIRRKENNQVIGYVWLIKNLTIPSLVYKPNPKIFEPKLVYSGVTQYEIIYDSSTNCSIALVSFQNILPWYQKIFADDEYRSVETKDPERGYIRLNSLKESLDYAKKHLEWLRDSWFTHSLDIKGKNIFIIFPREGEKKYQEVREMIRGEVIRYGGEKDWKIICGIWPSISTVK